MSIRGQGFLRELAQRVRSRRERAALGVSEAARQAGVSRRTWTEVEAGRANPSILVLLGIADALGETPADLLGLFVGTPLVDRSIENTGEMPPTVFLFQRNLERAARDEAELEREIRITLFHELGHALGFDEDGVEEMGLG